MQQEATSGALMARKLWAETELADWKERRALRLCQVEELQVCPAGQWPGDVAAWAVKDSCLAHLNNST